jgi:uncharacterized protein involved in exopolysaccharide biosynthesis
MEKHNNTSFDSTDLILFIIAWRKHIAIITIGSTLIALIASFIIAPKYKSTVILYPTTTLSASQGLLQRPIGGQKDYLVFGEEEEAEQLMQLLSSEEVRNYLSKKYNLLKHYEIKANDPLKNTYLKNEFESNISIKRTEFMSVKVDVLDINRDTAALIANDIASYVDSVRGNMVKLQAKAAFAIAEHQYNKLRKEIDLLEDSLQVLRNLGVYDYDLQLDGLMAGLGRALANGNTAAANQIKQELEVLKKYGGPFIQLKEKLTSEHQNGARYQLNELKTRYDLIKADTEKVLPSKYVVSKAVPAEKKAYPVRWLIVTLSAIASFFLAILIIISIEKIRLIKSTPTKEV